MATQTIYHVNEEWRDKYAAGYRVEHNGKGHDIYVEHGDLDDDSVDWGTMDNDASLVEDFKAAWKRYHAEKVKRSVVVSAATMRPMDDPALLAALAARLETDAPQVLFRLENEGEAFTTCRPHDAPDDPETIGWWPLPDLTPMPAEFGGWEV